MSVDVKICGLRDPASVAAAVENGAKFIGFVFCEKSRHRVEADLVARLIENVPVSVATVGLFVNPTNEELKAVLSKVPLTMLQLHGMETPERVASIKAMTKRGVVKSIGIASAEDVIRAYPYEAVADYLLVDAKPPPNRPRGVNGRTFDWELLENVEFTKPWLLAGGLNLENIEKAVAMTGAPILDVSSGVEDENGNKSPAKIKAFLDKARTIETCC